MSLVPAIIWLALIAGVPLLAGLLAAVFAAADDGPAPEREEDPPSESQGAEAE